MRGKTADEVANLSNQMYAELVRGNPRGGAPAPTPTPSPTGMPTDDQWLTAPGAAANQLMDARFGPLVQNAFAQIAGQSREIVKREYADDFRKWGPEIDLYINQTDPQFRTVENLQKIVGMVRANHIDEIAAERAERKLNEMLNSGAILRPGTAPAGGAPANPNAGVDLANVGLPENYARVLKNYDITPAILDEFLLKTACAGDMSQLPAARAKWVEQAKKGDIITERRTDRLVTELGG